MTILALPPGTLTARGGVAEGPPPAGERLPLGPIKKKAAPYRVRPETSSSWLSFLASRDQSLKVEQNSALLPHAWGSLHSNARLILEQGFGFQALTLAMPPP
jgi:hypothetical protein